MPDPFEALRTPLTPARPDPAFTARLRAQLEVALDLPKGVTMSDAITTPETVASPMRKGDIAYASLWVPDVDRAAAFFGAVLGWSYGPGSSGQGRQVEGATPHHGLQGGQERSDLFLCYAVDDVAAGVERVRAAGGQAEEPVTAPHGRVADCVDEDGTRFALYQLTGSEARGPANGARQGDLSYITMEVRDSTRARAFYATVVGWTFRPGRVEDGWGPEDVVPMTGMHGGHQQATVVPMYRVDDIQAAVGQVRALGGAAPEPERQPYGLSAECVDDQGTRFYLLEDPA